MPTDSSYSPLNPDQHRFIFKALNIKYAAMAKPGEFVIDDAEGIIYIMGTDGKLHSKSKELADSYDSLSKSGVISSALAFENNAQIYSLYVRDNHVRLDNMVKLNRNIRYWSARSVDVNGVQKPITGQLVNGQIENILTDVIPFTTDPAVAYPGEAVIGKLHTPSEIVAGQIYYVDFYDANRVILVSIPCQVIFASQLDFALSPDKNIVGIEIVTSQDMVDPTTQQDVAFIYQGQSLRTLNIYVYARYSDGARRYINHELATSRLVLYVPEDDAVDRLTIGNSFQITARYYTEQLNHGNDAAYNDNNYASIDGSKTVKVIEDVYTGLDYIFPIPVVRTSDAGVKQIKLYAFGKYKNDQLNDITGNARFSTSNFNEESFGILQTFNISLGIGHGGQIFDQNGLQLAMDPALYGRWTSLTVPNSPKGTYGVKFARFDPITNPGQIRMRLQPNEATLFPTVQDFASLGSIVEQDGTTTIPTHFRVRSVIESGFVHTIIPVPIAQYNEFNIIDTTSIVNRLAGFPANNDGVNYPVLVDFYKYDQATDTYRWLSMAPFITQQYVFSAIGGY